MNTRSTSRPGSGEERRSVANVQASAQLRHASAAAMPDARASSLAQLQHQERASNSSQAVQLKARADLMAGRGADAPAQRVQDEELLQGKFAPVERMDEEKSLQGKFDALQRKEAGVPLQAQVEPSSTTVASASEPVKRVEKPNQTGLPNQLKSGIESLSGMSMDHVKVHYNSDKPAQLQAHAYAQGSEIHVGPGQEKHVPHEAWHVVQQAQGRVKPTVQMKGSVAVNDDAALEAEADLLGQRAAEHPVRDSLAIAGSLSIHPQTPVDFVQRKIAHPTSWFPADKPAVSGYEAVAGLNSVTLDILTKTSKPEEMDDMGIPEIHATIMDPSRGNRQRLTKMHLIRGRFGAPGEWENLMLGTALSNNFDDDSHYAQVEKPIADFLVGDKGRRMVDYKVTPYGSPPAYFDARLKKHPSAAQFVSERCPQIFACAVQFAATPDNVNWYWSPQQIEHVRLDNKHTNGGDVVP